MSIEEIAKKVEELEPKHTKSKIKDLLGPEAYEAYRQHMREIGKAGGKKAHAKGTGYKFTKEDIEKSVKNRKQKEQDNV